MPNVTQRLVVQLGVARGVAYYFWARSARARNIEYIFLFDISFLMYYNMQLRIVLINDVLILTLIKGNKTIMAMYKNREVTITGVLEEMHPAKVYIEYVDGMEGQREAVRKDHVVVFDKKEVPESKVELDKDGKKVEDWRLGYATPTEEQTKIHENNMKLRQIKEDQVQKVEEFKPYTEAKVSTPVVKTVQVKK